MQTMMMLAPGDRVWRSDGIAATVTAIGAAGVRALVDGERQQTLLIRRVWRLALPCDRCDQAAEVELPDSPGDLLCETCGGGQPAARSGWVQPISHQTIRRMFAHCRRLG